MTMALQDLPGKKLKTINKIQNNGRYGAVEELLSIDTIKQIKKN